MAAVPGAHDDGRDPDRLDPRSRTLHQVGAGACHPGSCATASAVVLPLETRTFAQYTTRRVEIALAAVNAISLGTVVYGGATLAMPALLVYLQAGMLLLKRAAIASRSVAPADDVERHLAWREGLRRYWVDVCDSLRAIFALELAIGTITMATMPESASRSDLYRTARRVGWLVLAAARCAPRDGDPHPPRAPAGCA